MIKRVALIAVIAFFLLVVATAKAATAATLTGNVAFSINHANGTDINYKLYNVSSTSGTITLFNGGIDTFDNSGGGIWKREDIFPLAAATAEDAQYCIKISGDWINVTNSSGVLKESLYDQLFWDYVNKNGSDIRISNQNGQLYFWIEDFNATTQQATIWVNLSAGSTELNIAYGNPSALPSAYESLTHTFNVSSSFEQTITPFSEVGTISYSTTAHSGTYSLNITDTGTTNGFNYTFTVPSEFKIIEYIYITGATNAHLLTFSDGSYVGPHIAIGETGTTTTSTEIYYYNGAWVATGYYLTTNVWHQVKCIVNVASQTFDLYVDGQLVVSGGTYIGAMPAGTTVTFQEDIPSTAVGAAPLLVDDAALTISPDPASFSTPYAENLTTINATASINSVNYVANALNITIPYQSFTLPALSTTNWFNFSAEQGQFSANVTFSFTSTFSQTQTANFTELVVSSDVYVPANCTSNTLTISFNTSDVPSGVAIYSFNLSVLVNGTQVNFTKTATENLGVWYFTVNLNNIKQGWHSVKVLLVYQPAYLNITVYDANNVTTLLDKTLNVTVYDSNFNVLTSATVNKTANVSVVFAGKVFVRVSNGIGVARQLETTITPGNTTHLTFYFPTQNVVLATLQLVDYTNSFSNATVMIKRYITRNDIEVVDVQKVSANLQTSHYLIANVPYEVYITNGVDTRDLGYISVAYSQTITLYIGNLLNINAYPYVGVAFQINRTNNSIEITYKTEHGTTSQVNVVITNSTGYEVFNTTLTTQEGKVVYLINNTNETYYVSFHAENTFSPVTYKTIVSSAYTFSPVLPVIAGGSTLAIALPTLPGWMRALFFGGLVIFVALLFRRQFVPVGLTVSLAVLATFILTGVLKLSTNLLYVLATIVTVSWFAWWRMRR